MAGAVPTVPEMRRSLGGAWALFRGRPEGLDALDRSVEGFFRSFGVIVLLLPLNAVLVLAEMRLMQRLGDAPVEGFPVAAFTAAKFAAFAVDWLAFPVLLALFAGWLKVSRTYVDYVVARNWAAPLAMSLSAVPAVLFAGGLIGEEIAAIVFLIAFFLVMRYHYMVVRMALKVEASLALALVIGDLVLSVLIAETFSGFVSVG